MSYKWYDWLGTVLAPGLYNAGKEIADAASGTNGHDLYQKLLNTDTGINGSKYANVGFMDAIDNFFTGNLDYQRTLEQQRMAQNFNAAEAEKTREWENMMSSSSYQRGVQDLNAAGLNPALMYAGAASGASTPSVSSASVGQGHVNPAGKGFTAMMSVLSTLLLNSQKLKNDQIKLQNDSIKINNQKAYQDVMANAIKIRNESQANWNNFKTFRGKYIHDLKVKEFNDKVQWLKDLEKDW